MPNQPSPREFVESNQLRSAHINFTFAPLKGKGDLMLTDSQDEEGWNTPAFKRSTTEMSKEKTLATGLRFFRNAGMKVVHVPAIGQPQPVPGWHGVVSGGGPNPFPDSPLIPEHFKDMIRSGPNPFGDVDIPNHMQRVVQSGPDPIPDAPKTLEHMGRLVASGTSPFPSALKSREPQTLRHWNVSGEGASTVAHAAPASPTNPAQPQAEEQQPRPEDVEMVDVEQEQEQSRRPAEKASEPIFVSSESESEYDDEA
jgi:hypothetical protein